MIETILIAEAAACAIAIAWCAIMPAREEDVVDLRHTLV